MWPFLDSSGLMKEASWFNCFGFGSMVAPAEVNGCIYFLENGDH
jgi:hypothetical protein